MRRLLLGTTIFGAGAVVGGLYTAKKFLGCREVYDALIDHFANKFHRFMYGD